MGGEIPEIFTLCPLGFLSCVFPTAVPTARCTAMLIVLTLQCSERGWQQQQTLLKTCGNEYKHPTRATEAVRWSHYNDIAGIPTGRTLHVPAMGQKSSVISTNIPVQEFGILWLWCCLYENEGGCRALAGIPHSPTPLVTQRWPLGDPRPRHTISSQAVPPCCNWEQLKLLLYSALRGYLPVPFFVLEDFGFGPDYYRYTSLLPDRGKNAHIFHAKVSWGGTICLMLVFSAMRFTRERYILTALLTVNIAYLQQWQKFS